MNTCVFSLSRIVLLLTLALILGACSQAYVQPAGGNRANITVYQPHNIIYVYDDASDCSGRRQVEGTASGSKRFAVVAGQPVSFAVVVGATTPEDNALTTSADPQPVTWSTCRRTVTFTPEVGAEYVAEPDLTGGACAMSFYQEKANGSVQSVNFRNRRWRTSVSESGSWCR